MLNHYKKIVGFLGMALGENYEIVLHVVSDEGSYIEEIINNHVSGRSMGAPLTNLALEKIKEKDYLENDYILNYKVSVKNNKMINGSTFYIKDNDDKLLGLLCINADISTYKSIIQEVLQLMNVDSSNFIDDITKEDTNENFVEVLSSDIEDVIGEIIDPALLNNQITLSKQARLKIINELDEKGIFQLKGSVSKVATLLRVSEPSVYRYLQEIHQK